MQTPFMPDIERLLTALNLVALLLYLTSSVTLFGISPTARERLRRAAIVTLSVGMATALAATAAWFAAPAR